MKLLSIGEVSKQVGVAASALRYYERLGLLGTPDRISGQRRYNNEVITSIRAIKAAKQAGFTLSEINTFMHGFPAGTPISQRWRKMASTKIAELDTRIEQACRMRRLLCEGLECECVDLSTCKIVSVPHRQRTPN